ncbi:MAG: hypothetical protein IH812_05540 [Proteobacteria bacterium]|nr:hypothetical protein [Pseudomonadota bacterium]
MSSKLVESGERIKMGTDPDFSFVELGVEAAFCTWMYLYREAQGCARAMKPRSRGTGAGHCAGNKQKYPGL